MATFVVPGDVTFVIPDQWRHRKTKHKGEPGFEYENDIPPPLKLKWLTAWNLFTALWHTVLASIFIYLTVFAVDDTPLSLLNTDPNALSTTPSLQKNDPNELVRIASCWDVTPTGSDNESTPRFELTNEWVDTGARRKSVISTCIIMFHILSALFQGIPWFMYWCNVSFFVGYLNCVISTNGAQAIRYIEYTFSAPLMVIAIGLSFGILDVYTLAALGIFTATCMLFGLAADVLRVHARDTTMVLDIAMHIGAASDPVRAAFAQMCTTLKRYMYFFHVVSWVMIFIPWGIIMHVFFDLLFKTNAAVCGLSDAPDTDMPGEVLYLVFGEAGLFSLFGLVQFVQIMFYFDDNSLKTGSRVEYVFVLLSVIAKSSLGLVIFSSALFT